MIHSCIYVNTILSTTLQQKALEHHIYHTFKIVTVWSLCGRRDKINSSLPLKKPEQTELKEFPPAASNPKSICKVQ